MANFVWHHIDVDRSVRLTSSGHVSTSILRSMYEKSTHFDVALFGAPGDGVDSDALQPVKACKLVLMHASKHLHELFTADDYTDSHQSQYTLTEIGHESLSDIVKFIYTDELHFHADCASERMQKVLTGAKFLVMPDLIDASETYLASDEHLNLQNCMCMLRFARKYTCLSLLNAVLKLAAKNLPCFFDNLEFLKLSEQEVGKLLLSEPVITLADADHRCRAAIAWLNHDRAARDACVGDILNMVPFDLNTISPSTLRIAGLNSAIRATYAEKFTDAIFDGVKKYKREDYHCSNRAVLDVWWNTTNNNARKNTDMWYVIGGSNAPTEFVAYDVTRRYWSKLRDLPWKRAGAGSCVVGDKIFLFGGQKIDTLSPSADIDQFDLTTHEWTTSSIKLQAARHRLSACTAVAAPSAAANNNHTAYICGGCLSFTQDNANTTSNLMEKLSVDCGAGAHLSPVKLEVMPKMPVARSCFTAGGVGNAVFVAGGNAGGGTRLSGIQKYDCIADKWSTVGNMTCGRSSHMAAVLGDDDLYLAGGWDGTSSLSTVEIFDTRTGQIRQAPSTLKARSGGGGVALDRNTFCVVGGGESSIDAFCSVECYDIREGKWSTGSIVPDMPTANRNFGFACV